MEGSLDEMYKAVVRIRVPFQGLPQRDEVEGVSGYGVVKGFQRLDLVGFQAEESFGKSLGEGLTSGRINPSSQVNQQIGPIFRVRGYRGKDIKQPLSRALQ